MAGKERQGDTDSWSWAHAITSAAWALALATIIGFMSHCIERQGWNSEFESKQTQSK